MATGTPRHTWTDHTTLITAAKLNETEQDVADALATAGQAYTLASTPPSYVSPVAYGAAGDGTTDDTSAVQAAFDSGRPVMIDRTYLVGGLIALTGLTVQGFAGGLLRRKPASTYTISINPGSGGAADPSTNIRNVKFLGLNFDDNVATNVFRQGDAQLNLNACSEVLVMGCRFTGFRSDAIYLGSSNTGSTERHNQRIKIIGNWFDGVNNDNRNAISIVDGDDVVIHANSFLNCTRSNMPGAIDVEPNSGNTFAINRGIIITNNRFRGIGGNAGVIGLALHIPQASLINPARGFLISGNVVSGTTNALGMLIQQDQDAGATTAVSNIDVSGNVFSDVGSSFEIEGVRGVRVRNNTFTGTTSGSAIGYSHRARDVTVSGNTFTQVATVSGAVHEIYKADKVTFEANHCVDIGLTDGTYGVLHKFTLGSDSTGSSSFTDAVNNRVSGTGFTAFEEKNASHTLTASLNYAAGNRRINPTAVTNAAITPSASVWAAT